MIMKSHHYAYVSVSPWPLLVSLNSFNFLFSLSLFFKGVSTLTLMLTIFFLASSSIYWWLSYSSEMNLNGSNSTSLETGIKWGMILFISSEVFFFFSFFWSYFHYFLSPTLEVSMSWPPLMVEVFKFENVPLINTLILLSSGLTVTLAHSYLIEGSSLCNFFLFLTTTILMGLYFSFLQMVEYNSSFFSISDGTFGTSFFVLTGFHGLHVVLGVVFLSFSLLRSSSLYSSHSKILSFELSSWYWHFVDVVWIFLYFFLYYLNN